MAISIHSLRVEGDNISSDCLDRPLISIHSLRVEGDRVTGVDELDEVYFNPLPPGGGRPMQPFIYNTLFKYFNPLPPGGGRHNHVTREIGLTRFQSTPSGWRETQFGYMRVRRIDNFNPLPPGGGRHKCSNCGCHSDFISIHSLRVEGDTSFA